MEISNIPAYKLIDGWGNFIEECIDGYHWDYSEYIHEIKIRDKLQIKINTCEVDNIQLDKIKELDDKFKSLLKKDVTLPKEKYWWRQGVLNKAGEAYCYYMSSTHNIYVTNVDEIK